MKLFSLRSVVRERTLLAAGVFRGCQGVYAVAWVGSSPVTLFRVRVSHLARKVRAAVGAWQREERRLAERDRALGSKCVYGKASW